MGAELRALLSRQGVTDMHKPMNEHRNCVMFVQPRGQRFACKHRNNGEPDRDTGGLTNGHELVERTSAFDSVVITTPQSCSASEFIPSIQPSGQLSPVITGHRLPSHIQRTVFTLSMISAVNRHRYCEFFPIIHG